MSEYMTTDEDRGARMMTKIPRFEIPLMRHWIGSAKARRVHRLVGVGLRHKGPTDTEPCYVAACGAILTRPWLSQDNLDDCSRCFPIGRPR